MWRNRHLPEGGPYRDYWTQQRLDALRHQDSQLGQFGYMPRDNEATTAAIRLLQALDSD